MISFKISRWVLPLLLFILPAQAQTELSAVPQETAACQTVRLLPPIPANVQQVAQEIGIVPLLEHLHAIVSRCNQASSMSIEERAVRQQIAEAVLVASLDVDGVVAEIDNERSQILDVRAQLSSKRDRKINLISLANIVAGTGSGVIGTALQFSDRTAFAGDGIGVAGGAAGVFLSILGLRQQGKSAPLGVAPNMLAPLFQRTPELRSIYPESVWAFLGTAPVSDPRVHIPWREELIDEWVKSGRIGPPGAPASQKKIDLLTSRIGDQKHLSIDLLTDRSAMLLDLRARVLLMSRDLRDLMRAVALRFSD